MTTSTTLTNLTLTGTGWRPAGDWAALFTALPDMLSAWADLDGFHLAPPPSTPPPATHLWAWRPGLWLRVRLDTNRWTAATLHADDRPSTQTHSALGTTTENDIDADITTILPWHPEDNRIQQFHGNPTIFRPMLQITPHRPTTAPFIGDTHSIPENSPTNRA